MGELAPQYLWIALPVLIASAASLVTAVLMQARAEVALSRQREVLAEARAVLATQHRVMEQHVRAAAEASRRKALDQFMGDIHVEEREYVRESSSLFSRRSTLVLQQRVCFRNVPLTDWVEKEYPGTSNLVRLPARQAAPPPLPVAEPAPPAEAELVECVPSLRLLS